MISGIECAGLVLAVLPLVVEAAKAYSDGVESILNVTDVSRYNANLQDFYDDFYLEMIRLNRIVQQIGSVLYTNRSAHGRTLSTSSVLLTWKSEPQLEDVLRRFFGSEDQFGEFTVYSRKILEILEYLVEDKGLHIGAAEQNSRVMFAKLKALLNARERGETKSLLDRLRFSRRQEKRDKCLSKLQKRIQQLQDLLQRVSRTPLHVDAASANNYGRLSLSLKPPSIQARNLIANLHNVLCDHDACLCDDKCQITLCLGHCEHNVRDTSVEVEFLLSDKDYWQEGKVLSTASSNASERPSLGSPEKPCLVLRRRAQGFLLRFLVEDVNGQQYIWALDPRPQSWHYPRSLSPVTLRELLEGSIKLSLAEKRQLALLLASSVLLYHDSPWLCRGWHKEEILFFHKSEDEPDLSRPFLSTTFRDPVEGNTMVKGDIFHPNPDILGLGILMIEIFNEKPIESWRKRKDPVTANTNIVIADRVVKKMDECPSLDAIKACLLMDWLPGSKTAKFDSEDFRVAFLEHVVEPLRREVEWEKEKLPTTVASH